MPELRLPPQQRIPSSTTVGPRDVSPDSVIFTLESNFSLFSSAAASVDRCSFASDIHDQDSYASEISLNLTAHDGDFSHDESWNGTCSDPDPNKNGDASLMDSKKYNRLCRKGEKAKGHTDQKEDNDVINFEDGDQFLDSARSSFSLALKECQDRRATSELLYKKQDRQRPASLDLNNASPRLGVVKKNSASSRLSGTFPSPGTPNYRQVGVAMQKGWSSERVPLHGNASRKHLGAALLPLNNGRALPSKWEDAERWIFSPVSGDGAMRTSIQPAQRKPKSKSGPLGPPGLAYHSLFSPAMPMFEGVNGKPHFISDSPFSASTVAADASALHSGGHAAAFPSRIQACIARSVSVHGCTEMQNQPSLPGSQDDNCDAVKDAATNISRDVSRRDMATQMSPESSRCSSANMRPSFSASTLSALPIEEVQSVSSSKMEIRDVQVDERVTVTRWSKKNRMRLPGAKGSKNVNNWKQKGLNSQSSSWDVSETAKSISKTKREEAKITAWENLQKAKAEAAIRKLEMKLEKKRASSMDKIMNKLRSAQKKAHEMRSSASATQVHQVTRNQHKALSFWTTRQMGSLSGCFTCHAF